MEEWELDFKWLELRHKLKEISKFENLPDLQSILFLVGVQEFGELKTPFTKEEKQDLMHIGACALLEKEGYYKFAGRDEDGWPHYDVVKPFKVKGVDEQEHILKKNILEYFKNLENK